MMRRSLLFIFILVVLLVGTASLLAQPAMVVTEDNLLGLVRSNAPEKLIVKAISMASNVNVDTSLEGTVALMGKGVPESVIRALVERKEKLGQSSSQPQLATPAPIQAVAPVPTGTVPEETGVFIETTSGLTPLKSESVRSKSSSPGKFILTGGFGSLKTQGELDGPRSPVQLSGQVVLLVRTSGESVDEYQLVALESKKSNRQYTTSKTSIFKGTSGSLGTSFGPGGGPPVVGGMAVEFQKVAPNTYRAVLNLSVGEYGVLLPQQGNKLRTFGVY